MQCSASLAAYILSGLLITAYAGGRFNTPASNRSSTRQTLYRWGCGGYIVTALALFVCLSAVLQLGPWRDALFGPADRSSYPAPLMATLAMTTLLPSMPILQRLDAWLLAFFHNWASIPSEVGRRAAAILPEDLTVTEADVAVLQERYGDDTYGETMAQHLRANRGKGLELSEYRFTRVVQLYDQVRRLAAEPRYSKFFAESMEEFGALEKRVDMFLRRSDASLTKASRLRAVAIPAEYEEVMRERRQAFATSCRDVFLELALFLSHAMLRSEATEADIVNRLHGIGFSTAQPMNRPEFPIDSLTLLGLGLCVYVAAVSLAVISVVGCPITAHNLMAMCVEIGLSRIASISAVLWLIQRHDFFRRPLAAPHRHFAYLLCGVIGSAITALVFLPIPVSSYFESGASGVGQLWKNLAEDAMPVAISGMICAAVAFCCNDWVAEEPPPRWFRAAEAAGCAIVVASGLTLMVGFDLFPHPSNLPSWLIVVLPSIMSAMIGGYVPHIYRAGRRVAAARAAPEIQNPPADATFKTYESSAACAARTAVGINHEQRLVIAA
jgi:hypothetical protein